ncbi:MAG: hypothetical protein ABIV06_09400 [Thermoanaerobaculia bacterium]
MRDLERALLEAISESAEVHRTLNRMHREGYTLQLFLDCQPTGDGDSSARPERPRSEGRPLEPAFRINSDDLTLLRALGIDPTRKSRARK